MELYQLVMAETDVRSAVSVADEFIELVRVRESSTPRFLSEAFIAYVAICYARPFSHSRKSEVQSLPAKWGKFDDARLQHAHNKMIEYRHTLFAHSDPTDRTLVIVPPGGAFFGETDPSEIRWAMNAKTLAPHSIVDFRLTCIDLKERLQKRILELIDQLYGGMELPRAKFAIRFNDGL